MMILKRFALHHLLLIQTSRFMGTIRFLGMTVVQQTTQHLQILVGATAPVAKASVHVVTWTSMVFTINHLREDLGVAVMSPTQGILPKLKTIFPKLMMTISPKLKMTMWTLEMTVRRMMMFPKMINKMTGLSVAMTLEMANVMTGSLVVTILKISVDVFVQMSINVSKT